MAETCETVKIATKDGYAIINKSEFDSKNMKLYIDKPKRKAK